MEKFKIFCSIAFTLVLFVAQIAAYFGFLALGIMILASLF
jgi:hypothetical protein